MQLVIITDTFPPNINSGAIQLRDLTKYLSMLGHDILVITPDISIKEKWKLEKNDQYSVLRIKIKNTRDSNYIVRIMGELLMPFLMIKYFYKSKLVIRNFDGIIWYSPSIFLSPIVKKIREINKCKSYLIIRDIFPQWALDIGIIRKGLIYYFFKYIEKKQYQIADTIGVQTKGDIEYFKKLIKKTKIEVLNNWLGSKGYKNLSINIDYLKNKKIILYTGNIGPAQNIEIFIKLAQKKLNNSEIFFLYVGRGRDKKIIMNYAKTLKLSNIDFYDEIDPEEISMLCKYSFAGIISLDTRLKTHNIPGKFISYIQNGLPVFANVNKNNDIIEIINEKKIGKAVSTICVDELSINFDKFLSDIQCDLEISERCKNYFYQTFSVDKISNQIIQSFKYDK